MSIIEKYPNPQRTFVINRDKWFIDLIEMSNVPIHVFNMIRNSQLGQYMLLIQSNRSKMIRKGEEPGPDIFDKSTVNQLIPTYQIISQLIDLFKDMNESFDLSDFVNNLNIDLEVEKLNSIKLKKDEWVNNQLSETRTDDIIISSYEIMENTVFKYLFELFKVTELDALKEKLSEKNGVLSQMIFEQFDNVIYNNIKNNTWNRHDENEKIRVLENEGSSLNISEDQLYSTAISMYSFINELFRYFENREIQLEFPLLMPLMTFEMLIKIPYPENSFIPLIREHIAKLKTIIKFDEFFDLIFLFYQMYSFGINSQNNPKILNRMVSNIQSNFKETSKRFWKKIKKKNYENLIPVIWSSFSVSQIQLSNKINQGNNVTEFDKFTSNILSKLDKSFWSQSKIYFKDNLLDNNISFWTYNIFLTNKNITNASQSLDLFNKFDNLFKTYKIFEKENKHIDINNFDKYNLVQKILSYGLESRSQDIFDKLKIYTQIMKKLLENLEELSKYDLDISKELNAVEEIEKFLENPVYPDNI